MYICNAIKKSSNFTLLGKNTYSDCLISSLLIGYQKITKESKHVSVLQTRLHLYIVFVAINFARYGELDMYINILKFENV